MVLQRNRKSLNFVTVIAGSFCLLISQKLYFMPQKKTDGVFFHMRLISFKIVIIIVNEIRACFSYLIKINFSHFTFWPEEFQDLLFKRSLDKYFQSKTLFIDTSSTLNGFSPLAKAVIWIKLSATDITMFRKRFDG